MAENLRGKNVLNASTKAYNDLFLKYLKGLIASSFNCILLIIPFLLQEYILKGVANAALGQEIGSVSVSDNFQRATCQYVRLLCVKQLCSCSCIL